MQGVMVSTPTLWLSSVARTPECYIGACRDTFPEKEYIRKVYDQICNFLAIGEGEGLDRTYDFDIELFIRRFHMRPVQTRHAIEIMQLAKWLEYHDDDSRSMLRFLIPSKELYQPHIGPIASFARYFVAIQGSSLTMSPSASVT